jgi:hypothetical protein
VPISSDLAAQLAVLVEFGPKLRSAGYESIELGEIVVKLRAEAAPMAVETSGSDEEQAPVPSLHAAETYGLPPGAELPGFRRPVDLPKE